MFLKLTNVFNREVIVNIDNIIKVEKAEDMSGRHVTRIYSLGSDIFLVKDTFEYLVEELRRNAKISIN